MISGLPWGGVWDDQSILMEVHELLSANVMARKINTRPSRRDQNHHQVQSTATAKPQQIPDHPLICQDQAVLIEDNDSLAQLVAHVREVGEFAYDTEFIGEASFYPQLCVIQIATSQKVGLVDPLCDVDLTPIWQLIADPQIKTLVHAGAQDLEPVVRLLDLPPANIYDTQIAAAFASESYPASLVHLVETYCGVKLGKALTYTAWDRRPLSPTHQRYASDDVRYLPAIAAALDEQIQQAGYADALRSECILVMEQVEIFRPNMQAMFNRVRSNRSYSRRESGLLKQLVAWRYAAAKEQDMPPRSVVKDDVLVAMTKRTPKTLDALLSLKHMPRPIVNIYGNRLLELIADAKEIPKEELPQVSKFEETTAQRHRSEQLWIALNALCHGIGIHPALVTSRQELSRCCADLLNDSLPADHNMNIGWRLKQVTKPLQAMTQGKPLKLIWQNEHLKLQ